MRRVLITFLVAVVAVAAISSGAVARRFVLCTSLGGTHDVDAFTQSGTYMGHFSTGKVLGEAYGMDYGPDGNLYVCDYPSGTVEKFNGATGAYIGPFCTVTGPIVCAWGPDGNLYVGGASSKVQKFNGSTGAWMADVWNAGFAIFSICFAPNGDLCVPADSNTTVARLAAPSYTTEVWRTSGSPYGGAAQRGMRFGADGNLFVSDATVNAVQRYNGATGAYMDLGAFDMSNQPGGSDDLLWLPKNGDMVVAAYSSRKLMEYGPVSTSYPNFVRNFADYQGLGLGYPVYLALTPDIVWPPLPPENVEFWIGDSTGNPISQVNAAPGANFTVSVWMTSDFQTKAAELLFGYDTTNASGTGAPRLDNKIDFVSVSYGAFANAMTAKHAYNWYGGSPADVGDVDRPGGYRLAMMLPAAPPAALGAYPTATKVCDITLKNVGVAVGSNYYIGLWNGSRSATNGDTFATKARTTTRIQDLDVTDPFNPVYESGSGWAIKVVGSAGTPVSIDGAKSAAEGSKIVLSGAIVSARFRDANGPVSFAVEETDRSSGIRVVSTTAVNVGDKVNVEGTADTVGGERLITATSVTVVSSGNTSAKPVAMSNVVSAGGAYHAQGAVVNTAPGTMSSGRNSVGIYMTLCGKVTARNTSGGYGGYFYIDDGSGLTDGSGNIGVKCRPSGASETPDVLPNVGDYVKVTGVMGVKQIGGVNTRYFWTSSWAPAN